jgi:hypothetical protein
MIRQRRHQCSASHPSGNEFGEKNWHSHFGELRVDTSGNAAGLR